MLLYRAPQVLLGRPPQMSNLMEPADRQRAVRRLSPTRGRGTTGGNGRASRSGGRPRRWARRRSGVWRPSARCHRLGGVSTACAERCTKLLEKCGPCPGGQNAPEEAELKAVTIPKHVASEGVTAGMPYGLGANFGGVFANTPTAPAVRPPAWGVRQILGCRDKDEELLDVARQEHSAHLPAAIVEGLGRRSAFSERADGNPRVPEGDPPRAVP